MTMKINTSFNNFLKILTGFVCIVGCFIAFSEKNWLLFTLFIIAALLSSIETNF